MPQYPKRKADKNSLYSAIVAGVTANPALYPSGVGDPFELAALNGFIAAKNTAVNTRQQEEGQFRASVVAEEGTFENCDDETRRLINLAIAIHGVDSPNLVLIGWGPRAAAQSNVPGQARNLEAVVQGPGNLFLDWKAPSPFAGGEGAPPGAVGFYRIERRKRTLAGQQTEDWGVWQLTTTDSEISINNLERGVEYDFRVSAVSAAGAGLASNVVTVVL